MISSTEPGLTQEGYSWTAQAGVKEGGFICEGVITPSRNVDVDVDVDEDQSADVVYDVIVIGAGYAGLSAARDLTHAGRSVLMLEGRGRVGGRTYTVDEDGFRFEMGGTWVHHSQAYTFRELQRYGLNHDVVRTGQRGFENDYSSINIAGSPARNLSHDEAGEMSAKAWNLFLNVDGALGKKICPLPHLQLGNSFVDRKEVEKWDAVSCWDRLEEIKDQLSNEEIGILTSLLLLISGAHPDLKNSGFWDVVRAQAVNGYQFEKMEEIWFTYKLRTGQSTFARRMFDDAVDLGLKYSFKTAVDSIQQIQGIARVRTVDGQYFKGRKVICTVPLNVLESLKFDPPLSPLRQEAVEAGHTNFMTKIHAVVEGSGLASWNGTCVPNNLLCAYGDGVLPSGDAHLVAFGTDERPHFVPERDPDKVVDAFQKFHPMDVQKLVFHNWNTDPYSRAGPCWWPPGYMSKYQEELQKPHGCIFFASADWAHGWRAFIDGALEQGFLNGLLALKELRDEDRSSES